METPPIGPRRLRSAARKFFADASDAVIFFGHGSFSRDSSHWLGPGAAPEIAAHIDHALADRPGEWKISIVGSQANDRWEMIIDGPNGFERSYALEGAAGETEPQAIGRIVARMVA